MQMHVGLLNVMLHGLDVSATRESPYLVFKSLHGFWCQSKTNFFVIGKGEAEELAVPRTIRYAYLDVHFQF
jgi:hypothetical protein